MERKPPLPNKDKNQYTLPPPIIKKEVVNKKSETPPLPKHINTQEKIPNPLVPSKEEKQTFAPPPVHMKSSLGDEVINPPSLDYTKAETNIPMPLKGEGNYTGVGPKGPPSIGSFNNQNTNDKTHSNINKRIKKFMIGSLIIILLLVVSFGIWFGFFENNPNYQGKRMAETFCKCEEKFIKKSIKLRNTFLKKVENGKSNNIESLFSSYETKRNSLEESRINCGNNAIEEYDSYHNKYINDEVKLSKFLNSYESNSLCNVDYHNISLLNSKIEEIYNDYNSFNSLDEEEVYEVVEEEVYEVVEEEVYEVVEDVYEEYNNQHSNTQKPKSFPSKVNSETTIKSSCSNQVQASSIEDFLYKLSTTSIDDCQKNNLAISYNNFFTGNAFIVEVDNNGTPLQTYKEIQTYISRIRGRNITIKVDYNHSKLEGNKYSKLSVREP